MIVTCPACSTRYLVDPLALGSSGRTVRCSSCSHTWRQTPPPDLPRSLEPAAEVAGDRLPPPRYPVPAVPRRRLPWAGLAWAVAVVLALCVLVVGAVLARDDVVAIWPSVAPVFEMVGYPAAPQASDFRVDFQPRQDSENGTPVLVVEGEVTNLSRTPHVVYNLTMEFRDAAGNLVDRRELALGQSKVQPGGSVPFHATIQQPSSTAKSMTISITGTR